MGSRPPPPLENSNFLNFQSNNMEILLGSHMLSSFHFGDIHSLKESVVGI